MCYSANASFLTAATLAPIGGFCLNSALRRHRSLWPIATVPIAFAVQQAMEGVIWTSLDHHDQNSAELAAKVYLFFALAWWPFWGPLTALVAARTRRLKIFFSVWVLLSTGWFFGAYVPNLIDAQSSVQAKIVHHSIHYSYSDEVILGNGNRLPVTLLYLFFTAGPFFIQKTGNNSYLPTVIGFSSVLVAHYFHTHAYTSVWCIFAALLSSYCMVYFRRLDLGLITPQAQMQPA